MTNRTRLPATLDAVDAVAGPQAENLVIDLYLAWPDAPTDADDAVAALRDVLAAHSV